MEENKKTKLRQYNFSEITMGYIYAIQEKYGLSSETETLRMIIANQHSKEFPNYIVTRSQRPTPIEKEMAKLDAQEAKEDAKKQKEVAKMEGICLLMDEATIIPHPDSGFPSCRYPIYSTKSPHVVDKTWMIEDLAVLNDETPTLQYRGLFGEKGAVGKKKVLEILKKQAEREAKDKKSKD